jgi:hypothetical protein
MDLWGRLGGQMNGGKGSLPDVFGIEDQQVGAQVLVQVSGNTQKVAFPCGSHPARDPRSTSADAGATFRILPPHAGVITLRPERQFNY